MSSDAWAVRASVTGGRMPYARTRRTDVAHPFHGVATHDVDLDDIMQRAHALGLLLEHDAAISHSSAALVRGFPVPRALRLEPDLHVSVPRPRRAPRGAGVRGHSLELADAQVERLLVVAPSTREAIPVPLVDEPLTLLTCATQLALSDVVALADAMLQRAAVERRPDPMVAALELGRDRPGLARLKRAAPLRRAGVRCGPRRCCASRSRARGFPSPWSRIPFGRPLARRRAGRPRPTSPGRSSGCWSSTRVTDTAPRADSSPSMCGGSTATPTRGGARCGRPVLTCSTTPASS